MARIRETMGKIVYDEFNEALQKKGGLTKVDQADSTTLLFKPMVINWMYMLRTFNIRQECLRPM